MGTPNGTWDSKVTKSSHSSHKGLEMGLPFEA